MHCNADRCHTSWCPAQSVLRCSVPPYVIFKKASACQQQLGSSSSLRHGGLCSAAVTAHAVEALQVQAVTAMWAAGRCRSLCAASDKDAHLATSYAPVKLPPLTAKE